MTQRTSGIPATRSVDLSRFLRSIAGPLLYFVGYVSLDLLSYVRPLLALKITPWNPQAGLTLAFLLWFGPRKFLYTALAAFTTNVALRHLAGPEWLSLVGSLWVGVGYAGTAHLLRGSGSVPTIDSGADAARIAVIAGISTLVIALGHVGLYWSNGLISAADFVAGVARYWVGDLNGVLCITPLLLGRWNSWGADLPALLVRKWEVLAQFVVIVLTLWIIFRLPAADQLRFFYLLFVPVVWIALRWGWRGAMLTVLVLQVGLQVAAETKIPTARFIDLQFLMLTLSLTALVLGAVVSERAAVLRRVAAREAEQRTILAMAPDAVLAVQTDGKIRSANPAAIHLFGDAADEKAQALISALMPQITFDSPQGHAALEGLRPDGTAFPAEVAWARLDPPANSGFLLTVRDATERRQLEEQAREKDAVLARAMRFAVAGELASSLAHELNQPITALVSYLRAADILASTDPERLRITMSKAAREAIRASEVLRRLRDFYQTGTLKRDCTDVEALCVSVTNAFHERLRRAEVSFTVSLDSILPSVQADSTQLEIVLHNLLANALDALAMAPHSSRHIALSGSLRDGMIELHVQDSGPGVVPEFAAKLFEPFVTNKPTGMGLGLAIARSLARAHGGDLIYSRSVLLGGACFTIRLPASAP